MVYISIFFCGAHMTTSADGTLFTDSEECLEQCKAHPGTKHNLDMFFQQDECKSDNERIVARAYGDCHVQYSWQLVSTCSTIHR